MGRLRSLLPLNGHFCHIYTMYASRLHTFFRFSDLLIAFAAVGSILFYLR